MFPSLTSRHLWPTQVNWKKQRKPYIAFKEARDSKFAAIKVDGMPLRIQDATIVWPGEVSITVRRAEGRCVLLPVGGPIHSTALILWGERRESSSTAKITALDKTGPCTWLVSR